MRYRRRNLDGGTKERDPMRILDDMGTKARGIPLELVVLGSSVILRDVGDLEYSFFSAERSFFILLDLFKIHARPPKLSWELKCDLG